MTISVGDRLPEVTLKMMGPDGPKDVATAEIFTGKKIVLFALPGAYTPTCHNKHLPGFLANLEAFKAKGIDDVVCTAVNDAFVLAQWARDTGAEGKILFLADGNGEFARAIGLDLDLSAVGLGLRSNRYAMIVEDGVVRVLNIEEIRANADISSAEALLDAL